MRFPRPHCGVRGPRQNSGSIGQRWKRREALASRLVLMGRHHTNPPNPGTHPPKRRTPPQGGRTASPEHEKRGQQGGGTANQTPPHPRRAHKHGPNNGNKEKGGARRSRNHYTNHDQPTPHPATPNGGPTRGGTQSCGGHSTGETPSNIPNLEAKPGRANGTAPQGVRESRKPPQHTTKGGPRTQARPPHTHTHTRTSRHTRTQQRARGHATTRTRAHTPTRARHQRGPNTDHANTRARTSAHEPHPRATTRTRASYCARPPSGLRLFMFQQSSGR